MARTRSRQGIILQPPTLRLWSKGRTCSCELCKQVLCSNLTMELCGRQRRRCNSQALLPALLTIKSWNSIKFVSGKAIINKRPEDGTRQGRCTRVASIPRADHRKPTQSFQFVEGKPFPFFELPREIRDQIYSSLVVQQDTRHIPILDATAILMNRKKRLTAQKARIRQNQQRCLSGKPPIRARTSNPDPILNLELLRTSQRMYGETMDCLYSNNWFAISLGKLPSTVFDYPDGWVLPRIKRLRIELQIKDSVRMNRYIDWASFFSTFASLRSLRVIFTYHPRYYEWAHPELCDWSTTHYVHKAFFRELLAAIPGRIDLKINLPTETVGMELQGKVIDNRKLLEDMYEELGCRIDSAGRSLAVNGVVEGSHAS